jgi:hypothetical protein
MGDRLAAAGMANSRVCGNNREAPLRSRSSYSMGFMGHISNWLFGRERPCRFHPLESVGINPPLSARFLADRIPSLLLLSHPRRHQRVFRRNSDLSRGFQGTADVGVFRTRIKRNQPHAVWTLYLITGLKTRSSFRKGFATTRAKAFNSISHGILPTDGALRLFTTSLTKMTNAS